MTRANVGAAVVLDPDDMAPGIFTERDRLRACAARALDATTDAP